MVKPVRSPERAAAIIDRASRSKAFKPSILDQRPFDRQMVTPGNKTRPLNINGMDPNGFVKLGSRTVNPRDILSDQPTISVKAVKGKIAQIAAGGQPQIRLLQRADGKLQMMDGNHGTTGYRAMGIHPHAEIYAVKGSPAARGVVPIARPPVPAVRPAMPSRIPAGRAALAVAVAGAAVAGYRALTRPASGADQSGQQPPGNSSRSENGRADYQKANGEATQGTKAQIEAWRKRRTAS